MRRSRLRASQGQAVLEFALIVPVLFILMLGASDLAQGYFLGIDITGAARAGMREGSRANSSVLGESIRGEPAGNTGGGTVGAGIPDTVSVWGLTAYNQTNGCDPSSTTCGDPYGCQTSGAHNAFAAVTIGTTTYHPIACFAVQTCTITSSSNSYVCTPSGVWGTRPGAGTNSGMYVRVVYKFTPQTPLIASLAGTGGAFYLTATCTGMETY
ncbi:MAG: pilus assembly protein [Candidatus Dormibacteraeota bacterium]|nr:pilus assembly protein [Candidatus Dormibacteraeota bacterium]